MKNHKTHLIIFPLLLLLSTYVQALAPAGTIERATKQQILGSIPPSHETTPTASSQLFLTSPSEKYAVFFLRRESNYGAGGFGSDFCYVQVQDSGESVWESECTAVSNINTCSLVFTDAGLEIFDGSRSAWNTNVEDDDAHLESLVLLDSGDMHIRNKDGDLKWKASDNPIANQNCGSIGAPQMSSALPPFASPIHQGRGPFGQQVTNQQGQQVQSNIQSPLGSPQQQPEEEQQGQLGLQSPIESPQQQQQPEEEQQGQLGAQSPLGSLQQQQQPEEEQQGQTDFSRQNINQPFPTSSLNQPFGVGNQQPLVDNTPFDSGSSNTMVKQFELQMGLICLLGFMGYFTIFFS
ncbi:hypothetical protein ACHQM5_001744 [Ranunculus cassubicifolius]